MSLKISIERNRALVQRVHVQCPCFFLRLLAESFSVPLPLLWPAWRPPPVWLLPTPQRLR